MAAGSGKSCLLATMLAIVLFSGMQMFRNWLAGSPLLTIFGGYLSSLLFVFVLTAVGNLETTMFGKGFQTKVFPEIVICMGVALFAASMIHRVCITTCILFSIPALYYMNKLSQQVYAAPVVTNVTGKKKRGN